ncbi:AAA family ATPase [Psychromonas sp. RZ22]|uniref:AAA family ATPase n=1 Tax=Psychromonas algarum TaxID=2555643 RepID=UPI00106753F3|nr:AAA family ATPase [Psychromonas sp. RZ22]TEW53905.1 AAA family ATPase [Psychromonas sp. RZ22]
MYQEFFSLKEQPFSISPDPDFLFLSDRHKEALAHLMYGLQGNGGFVLLTGEVGTGKTTVCRVLLKDLSADTDVAFVLNPAQTEVELLATICDQLNIAYDVERASLKTLFDAISSWMIHNLEKGRNAIVLIDEAQHLSFSVLEQLRLLTNIESNNKKPLQVILIGQTELQQKLKETKLRQLAQRITARYHLLPLNLQETEFYIQHRLNVAGASYPIFDAKLLKRIFKYSHGIPRLINLICDRSMLCAYSQNSHKVTAKMVDLAVKEIDLSFDSQVSDKPFKHIWRFALLAILGLFFVMQAPKIGHHFNQPIQAIESVFKLKKMDNTSNSIPDTPEVVSQDSQLPKETPTWFDNYTGLDLTEGQFSHALQTLYAVWGYSVDLKDATCENGESVFLQCFSDNVSLQKLKEINYPTVIKLVNEKSSLYAVLYKASDQYEILIGEQKIQVSEAWLIKYWNGGITLLWRTPFEVTKPLSFGEKGNDVAWLNMQLNTLYGLPENNNDRFDWKLKEKVIKFQYENNLVADGIVGKRTLISLTQQLEPKTPSLL